MDTRYTNYDDAQKSRTLTLPSDFAGFGGLGLAQVQSAWNTANSYARAALPPPARAAIMASPLSAKGKAMFLKEPLALFPVLADFSEDKTIEFIKRVLARSPGAQKVTSVRGGVSYRQTIVVGGRSIRVAPVKGNEAMKLSIEMIAVCWAHPLEAHIVGAQMALEMGGALLNMTGAAVGASFQQAQAMAANAAKQAQAAAQQAGKTAQQAAQAAQQAAQEVTKAITSLWPFKGLDGYAGFGDAGVVSGPAVATGSVAAAGATEASLLTTCIETAILMAPVLIPLLVDLVSGMIPKAPTPAQKTEAKQGEMKLAAAEKQSGKTLVPKGPLDNIAASVGLSPTAIAVGGAAALIGLVLIARK